MVVFFNTPDKIRYMDAKGGETRELIGADIIVGRIKKKTSTLLVHSFPTRLSRVDFINV